MSRITNLAFGAYNRCVADFRRYKELQRLAIDEARAMLDKLEASPQADAQDLEAIKFNRESLNAMERTI